MILHFEQHCVRYPGLQINIEIHRQVPAAGAGLAGWSAAYSPGMPMGSPASPQLAFWGGIPQLACWGRTAGALGTVSHGWGGGKRKTQEERVRARRFSGASTLTLALSSVHVSHSGPFGECGSRCPTPIFCGATLGDPSFRGCPTGKWVERPDRAPAEELLYDRGASTRLPVSSATSWEAVRTSVAMTGPPGMGEVTGAIARGPQRAVCWRAGVKGALHRAIPLLAHYELRHIGRPPMMA